MKINRKSNETAPKVVSIQPLSTVGRKYLKILEGTQIVPLFSILVGADLCVCPHVGDMQLRSYSQAGQRMKKRATVWDKF